MRIDKNKFWGRAAKLVEEKGYERTLAYLKLLVCDPAFQKNPLNKKDLSKLASEICYYPGVTDGYFKRLQKFMDSIFEVREWGIKLEHYIISSGLKEILDGTSIQKHFKMGMKMSCLPFLIERGKP